MSRPRPDGSEEGARATDRAVSEVLSYSLIFGLIVASIGIVTVGGLGSLQSAQTNEQLSNAERAFDVLHDNLADIHSEGAPSRSTEISLGESELFFDANVTMRVGIENASGPFEFAAEIRPIVFRVEGERQLIYEAGATIRHAREGGIILNDPPFTISDSGAGHVHLPIVRTTSADVQSMGSTTILVRGQSWNRDVLHRDLQDGSDLKYIELETPRFEAWANYFDHQAYCDSVKTPSTETVRCNVDGSGFDDPHHLYVTEQAIEIELIQ